MDAVSLKLSNQLQSGSTVAASGMGKFPSHWRVTAQEHCNKADTELLTDLQKESQGRTSLRWNGLGEDYYVPRFNWHTRKTIKEKPLKINRNTDYSAVYSSSTMEGKNKIIFASYFLHCRDSRKGLNEKRCVRVTNCTDHVWNRTFPNENTPKVSIYHISLHLIWVRLVQNYCRRSS